MGSVLCNMPTSALLSSDGDVEKLEASDPAKPAFTPELSAITLLLGEILFCTSDPLLKDDKENESGAVVSGDGINPPGPVTLDLEITDATLACEKKKKKNMT